MEKIANQSSARYVVAQWPSRFLQQLASLQDPSKIKKSCHLICKCFVCLWSVRVTHAMLWRLNLFAFWGEL